MNKYEYIPSELIKTKEPYAKVTYRDYTVVGNDKDAREYSYKVIHVDTKGCRAGKFSPDFGIVKLVGHSGEYAVSPQDFLCYEQYNAPLEIPQEA
jgi:hypothetical protein